METKKILQIVIRFFIVIAIILMILICLLFFYIDLKEQKSENKSILENLLTSEIINKEGWVCLDYAIYYNKTLSEKYPELDIRFPRHVDVCNNLTICDSHHTFLIIGGYGSECMLDQKRFACINVIKNNQTKEEIDKLGEQNRTL